MVTVQEIAEIMKRLRADCSAFGSAEEIGAAYNGAIDSLDALAVQLKNRSRRNDQQN